MRPRVYTDTSVLGGCEDAVFQDPSRKLIEAFQRGAMTLVLSELTIRELANAPAAVKSVLRLFPRQFIEATPLSEEAEELATEYIRDGAISVPMRADAVHIAIATVARVDVLVSWNFKHIVNLRRIHAYNAVNLRMGYPLLEIRTPWEVATDE